MFEGFLANVLKCLLSILWVMKLMTSFWHIFLLCATFFFLLSAWSYFEWNFKTFTPKMRSCFSGMTWNWALSHLGNFNKQNKNRFVSLAIEAIRRFNFLWNASRIFLSYNKPSADWGVTTPSKNISACYVCFVNYFVIRFGRFRWSYNRILQFDYGSSFW